MIKLITQIDVSKAIELVSGVPPSLVSRTLGLGEVEQLHFKIAEVLKDSEAKGTWNGTIFGARECLLKSGYGVVA